ncbi:hypothetical protein GCM10010191_79040 [Actinomadura vinacea]|uniref:MFS transporter n=1 Tax=Actinomadura vinacea TaxID=115336 RepID=A0ABN3K4X4_9ACTN
MLAAGNAATVTAASTGVMASTGPERAGSAAALNETAFKLGGSLGVAVLGGVPAGHLAGRLAPAARALPPKPRALATESISEAMAAARRLGGADGERLAATAREAFTAGLGRAALLAAALALAASFVTALALRGTRRRPAEERNDHGP